MTEQLMTPTQVADMVQLHHRVIYRAIANGELRAYRLRSRFRIPIDAVQEWLAASQHVPERPAQPVLPRPRPAPAAGSMRAMLKAAG